MNPGIRPLTSFLCLAVFAACCAKQPTDDPLLAGDVSVPVTPGALLLRELTHPPGLFVWTTLKQLEPLNAAQLRTLAHGLWRAQRRDVKLTATPMVIEAWAERDAAGLVNEMLTLLQWEQSGPGAGAPGAGIDAGAAAMWCRLAEQSWAQALPLLNKVSRNKPGLAFWLPAAAEIKLPLERVPVFLTTAGNGMDPQHMDRVLGSVMWSAVKNHGAAAAARAVAKIKLSHVRKMAEAALQELRKDPPSRDGARPVSGDNRIRIPALRKLLALDTARGESSRIPYRLLREVLKLTAGAAMDLAKQLPLDPPPGHWLAWMLFMRAAEGDPVAAEEVAAETGSQLIRAGQPAATVFALRPGLGTDTALREIRDMASPDKQRQSLSGFLTGNRAQEIIIGEFGNPVMGYASQLKLPAEYWRAGLCRAAVSGGGEAALRLARGLAEEPDVGRAMLEEDIAKAWALCDLPSLTLYAEKLENPDELKPVTGALDFVRPLLPVAGQPEP